MRVPANKICCYYSCKALATLYLRWETYEIPAKGKSTFGLLGVDRKHCTSNIQIILEKWINSGIRNFFIFFETFETFVRLPNYLL